MINVKKGPAHSLGQADVRGNWDGSTAFTQGGIAYVDVNGTVQTGLPVGAVGTPGFVIDGPVISGTVGGNGSVNESGKIALYTFDGASIIETDQVVEAVTAANCPIGAPVYGVSAGNATTANIGKVTCASATAAASGTLAIIGWVEGIRTLQLQSNYNFGAQNYTSEKESDSGTAVTRSYTYRGQYNIPVLSIKLGSGGFSNSHV